MSTSETRAELLLRQEVWKASLLVNSLGTKAMDYENAVLCLKHSVSLLEFMPPTDPAYAHFVKEARHFQKLATAHAVRAHDQDGTVHLEHLTPFEVLWAYRANDGTEVVEETVLYIPLMSKPIDVDYELAVAGTRRLISENLKYEYLASLQIVRQ